MHTFLLVLHVVAAVFLIGPMAVLPMSGLRALRNKSAEQVVTIAKSTYTTSLLSLIVPAVGMGVLGTADASDDLSFGTTWIWLSLLLYAVALAVNLAVVVPALRAGAAQLAVAGSDAPIGPAYQRISISNGVASLLLIAVVVLMVWQP
jgi:uncharacterized membrane protein